VVAVVNEEYREPPNAVFENGFIRALQISGQLESGNTRVYAIYADGVAHGDSNQISGWNPIAFLPGWPVKTALVTTELLPTVGTGSNGPPVLADVDGDGTLEIGTMSAVGPAYVFTADGVSLFGRHPTGEDRTLESDTFGAGSKSVDTPTFGALGALAIAEFGGVGQGFQLIGPTAGLGKLIDNQIPARQFPADNHLSAWNVTDAAGMPTDGAFVAAYPRVVNDLQFLAGPAIADIDGDGHPEALEGSGVYDLHAIDITGKEALGWAKFTNGWAVQSPAVGDVDGDGRLEVVATTREGNLFVWKTAGDECGFIPWRRWHHDEWGTGNYHTDARPPASLRAQDVVATAQGPLMVRIDLARVPGDGLFCGTAAFEVRVAETPIVDQASFAAATKLNDAGVSPAGRRGPGTIIITDSALVGRNLYIGIVAHDAAGNRSAVVSVGPVQFPPEEPPTATVTPTPSPTNTVPPTNTAAPTNTTAPTNTGAPTATNTPASTATNTTPPTATATHTCGCTPTATHTEASRTPTSTAPPTSTVTGTATRASSATPVATNTSPPSATPAATNTSPPTPTATKRRPTDSGCNVQPSAGARDGSWLLLLPALALLAQRRRGGRR
jgi:hypothetical protein